jgi:DNA-directed RNA polymerase specialized sigma24 family protein
MLCERNESEIRNLEMIPPTPQSIVILSKYDGLKYQKLEADKYTTCFSHAWLANA